MEAALVAKLLASTGITALTGTRINWLRRPQAEALPAIVLQRIDGAPDIHHGGASGLVESRVQVDVWAKSFKAAKDIARAVQAAVTAQRFVQGAVRFDLILIVDERDSTEDVPPDTLFRTSLDLMVHSAAA